MSTTLKNGNTLLNKHDVIVSGEYPMKMLGAILKTNILAPIHATFNITNKCQLSCPYCGLKDRDVQQQDMWLEDFVSHVQALDQYYTLKAITFSGGGEPLMNKQFENMVLWCTNKNYKMGLVTNGINLSSFSVSLLQEFKWIRISFDSDRKAFPKIPEGMEVGVSYLYREGDEQTVVFQRLIEWAETGRITHLRLAPDILNLTRIPDQFRHIKNVMVQDRTVQTKGTTWCWVGLVHPTIDVDGQVLPCCGTHYAIPGRQGSYPEELKMGCVEEYLAEHVTPQKPFNGDACKICYYQQNNRFLEKVSLCKDLQNRSFV